jgi:quinol monooxygenase YgiN
MKYTMARYTVRPEKVREIKKALAEFIAEVRANEPRTLYLVFRENGRHSFVHWMAFENEAAERRHSQSRYNDLFAKKLLANGVGKAAFTEFSLVATTKKQWVLAPAA